MSPIILRSAIVLIASISYCSAASIEITKFDVPPHANRGKDLQLTCEYDLKGQKLQSISWFFNTTDELYRYSYDKKKSIKQSFLVANLEVDERKSSSTVLALKHLPLEATGTYTCSVNTEAPHFHVVEKQKFLEVVVIPKEPPRLEGIPTQPLVKGETRLINCTSAPSKPPSTLTFVVGGLKMKPKFVKHYEELTDDGLYITTAVLELSWGTNLFRLGNVEVKCQSKINSMERTSAQAVVKSAGDAIRRSLGILIISLLISIKR